MNDLKVFENADYKIRTLNLDGEPLFVGKDVAIALGYTKPENALARHVESDDTLKRGIIDAMGREQETTLINESGLYSLILSSKLPTAKEFKHWVTSEVLPAIRKTGEYSLIPVTLPPEVEQRELTTDDYLKAAALVATCKSDRLPYVLGFLEQGGFSIPQLKSRQPTGNECLSLSQILRKAQGCGVTLKELEKLTGIQDAQLCRYKAGQKPHDAARVEYIIRVVEEAISQRESAAEPESKVILWNASISPSRGFIPIPDLKPR